MKQFVSISLVVLAIAFTAILSQNGKANAITYGGVAPLVIWVLLLVIRA